MSNTDEKHIDIAAEMRAYADRLDDAGVAPSPTDLRKFAERIERAANNLESNFGMALAIEDGLHKRDKQPAPGNAAAMRESIETMRRYAMLPPEQLSLSLLQRTIHEKCDAALSAPARNCDVGTAEEQEKRFDAFCDSHKWVDDDGVNACLSDCPLYKTVDCALHWSQMPFAPAEVTAKCVNGLRGEPDCRGCNEHCEDVRKRNCFYWNPDIEGGVCALTGKKSCPISCDNFCVPKKVKPAEGGKE